MRRRSIEIRRSSDGSTTSWTYYYEDMPYALEWGDDDALEFELGGRAAHELELESGEYRDHFSFDRDAPLEEWHEFEIDGVVHRMAPSPVVPAVKCIIDRCTEARGGGLYRDGGERLRGPMGEHPQETVSIKLYEDGSLTTSAYWLHDRDYEMLPEYARRVEKTDHPNDTEENIAYRCTHTKRKGRAYLEPGRAIPLSGGAA